MENDGSIEQRTPSIPAVRWSVRTPTRPGFQRHHILPAGLLRRRQFRRFFAWLSLYGFAINRFSSNGILLPASGIDARRTRRALHRGPHPGYSDIVASRVETIRVTAMARRDRPAGHAARDAIGRLTILQAALRRTLDGSLPRSIWLNRRDPMRLYADTQALDRQIYALFPD